jgi:hypothetical protein
VNAHATNLDVVVTWEPPVIDSATVTHLGYNIYRDNVKLNGSLVTILTWNDNPLSSGHYTYCVTAVYVEGESSKTCKDIEVIALGSNTLDQSAQISVYPNPANDVLHVHSVTTISDLRMTDFTGKEVFRSRPGNETVDIPVSSFHSGVYLLTLQTAQGTYHAKVIIR